MVDIFSFRPPLCSSVSLRLCGECFPSGFWILNSVRSFLTPEPYHPRLDKDCPSRIFISASKPPPQTSIYPQIPRAIASSTRATDHPPSLHHHSPPAPSHSGPA